MSKNCEQCNNPFEDNTKSGYEQKYCSTTCRYKAANIRRENKIKLETINSINEKQETTNSTNLGTNSDIATSNLFQNEARYNFPLQPQNQRMDNYKAIELLEKNFETKGQLNYAELRIEYLTKELEEYKKKNTMLEFELDSLEDEDDSENDSMGKIGDVVQNLITQFKSDPINTISFAKELIGSFLSPQTKQTA
jgi:hypothetical protein